MSKKLPAPYREDGCASLFHLRSDGDSRGHLARGLRVTHCVCSPKTAMINRPQNPPRKPLPYSRAKPCAILRPAVRPSMPAPRSAPNEACFSAPAACIAADCIIS